MLFVHWLFVLYVKYKTINVTSFSLISSKAQSSSYYKVGVNMRAKVLFLCFVFTTMYASGTCMECYVCAGTENSDCAKGVIASMALKLCSVQQSKQLQTVCLKATATEFNPKLVERSCGTFPSETDPCKILVSSGVFENCYFCKTDKCNVGDEFSDNNSVE